MGSLKSSYVAICVQLSIIKVPDEEPALLVGLLLCGTLRRSLRLNVEPITDTRLVTIELTFFLDLLHFICQYTDFHCVLLHAPDQHAFRIISTSTTTASRSFYFLRDGHVASEPPMHFSGLARLKALIHQLIL